MASKKIELIHNNAGGIDLIVERDAGNEVRILTGKAERSKEFWENMRDTAETALRAIEFDEENG